MTDTAERIAKLADAIYPEPPTTPTQPWRAWNKWRYCIDDMLNIATPGAQLGALVDLFDFALAGKGWHYRAEQGPSGQPHTWTLLRIGPEDQRYTEITRTGPTAAAALLAAMEDL